MIARIFRRTHISCMTFNHKGLSPLSNSSTPSQPPWHLSLLVYLLRQCLPTARKDKNPANEETRALQRDKIKMIVLLLRPKPKLSCERQGSYRLRGGILFFRKNLVRYNIAYRLEDWTSQLNRSVVQKGRERLQVFPNLAKNPRSVDVLRSARNRYAFHTLFPTEEESTSAKDGSRDEDRHDQNKKFFTSSFLFFSFNYLTMGNQASTENIFDSSFLFFSFPSIVSLWEPSFNSRQRRWKLGRRHCLSRHCSHTSTYHRPATPETPSRAPITNLDGRTHSSRERFNSRSDTPTKRRCGAM